MFPDTDYLSPYLLHEENDLKKELKKAFSELVSHFHELSNSFDSGFVDDDISYYFTKTEIEDTVTYIAFFFEQMNIIIHYTNDRRYKLVIKSETGDFIHFYENSHEVIDQVLTLVDEVILFNSKKDGMPLQKKIKRIFNEESSENLDYLDEDATETNYLYALSMVAEYVERKIHKEGYINTTSGSGEFPYYYVSIDDNKSFKITGLDNNNYQIIINTKEKTTKKTVKIIELLPYISKILEI